MRLPDGCDVTACSSTEVHSSVDAAGHITALHQLVIRLQLVLYGKRAMLSINHFIECSLHLYSV